MEWQYCIQSLRNVNITLLHLCSGLLFSFGATEANSALRFWGCATRWSGLTNSSRAIRIGFAGYL